MNSRALACALAACLLGASPGAFAETCEALAKRIGDTIMGFHPPLEGRSVKARAISAYTAPAAHCRIKKTKIPPNSYFIVYTPVKGWLEVGFTGTFGEDKTVWVRATDVQPGHALGSR